MATAPVAAAAAPAAPEAVAAAAASPLTEAVAAPATRKSVDIKVPGMNGSVDSIIRVTNPEAIEIVGANVTHPVAAFGRSKQFFETLL